ncbi:VOC family protein [Chondromyces apiculatus]|uniref:Transposase, IS493 family n=1 Tax=Chondromyces apiculatus DSM 436 TaxID=1192034 RepID=A0A017T6V7_9BACT|nr:VOC family protein [Chondromyces apiculatus]EYF04988.1 transposase, IS493 family [Chondromyces apiculatus DSM 436]
MATHHKPPTFTAVTPYLTTTGADDLIAFLQQVFGAQLVDRHTDESGRVAHATVRIDDAVLEVSEANDTWKAMPLALHVYVPDVDATYKRAIDAGARSTMEPKLHDYGERGGGVQDRWGNHWFLATYVGQPGDKGGS